MVMEHDEADEIATPNDGSSILDEWMKKILKTAADKRQRGTDFERLVKWFLQHDPSWQSKLQDVWMWDEAPTNDGQDTGIDLVALDVDGSYWAIQAKCYSKSLSFEDVSTFLAKAHMDKRYQHYMLADSAPALSGQLKKLIGEDTELTRVDYETMRDANVDWDAFIHNKQAAHRTTFDPRPHQREAIDSIKKTFETHDRCSLVMACGTGKTLTSLRLCEEMLGMGGTVLFLAPSISLISQTMRAWVNQIRDNEKINLYVVCSDPKASKIGKTKQEEDEAYGRLSDLPYPATTNPVTIAHRFRKHSDALNVIFSTYQSIDVIHQAQQNGLFDFDLTICDEAHRTTGVMDGESAFQRVHDQEYLRSDKRLYMTATPRIYGEDAKRKAREGVVPIASMDDEKTYGPIAYRLGFGQAVERGLLTDYKIVVMGVTANMVRVPFQSITDAGMKLQIEDTAKFIGCWKALFDRRHARGVEDIVQIGRHARREDTNDDAKRPLHHAIAFASSIKASKQLSAEFQSVIDAYTNNETDSSQPERQAQPLHVTIDHIDGTMDSELRKEKLAWLAADEGEYQCHILSNARCLAEGIDVPDLDAVIYLSSRRSKVDIIQSVGRVMRRAPGKEYGYIIIPVFLEDGEDPDAVLSTSAFSTVWDVVRALRSHDERLDAIINSAQLGDTTKLSQIVEFDVLDASKLDLDRKHKQKDSKSHVGDKDQNPTPSDDDNPHKDSAVQDKLNYVNNMDKGVIAQIVRKCGTKVYWGEWTADVATIAKRRVSQIGELIEQPGPARDAFLQFLKGLRDSLNSDYTEVDAVAVLAQHEITKPIFATLFTDSTVLDNNPITQGLDSSLNALYEAGLPRVDGDATLRDLYANVRMCANQLESDVAKQNLIKEIYNEFFTVAFSDTADSLGIVYTPVEVVDAQLHMVQRALKHEFGQSLSDRGVHVLDGFAGTGTYICRLIEDKTLISDKNLPYKYANDLHSNEIVPLAATIMDINIEQSYHKRTGGEYQAFPGALLTDTFQMREDGHTEDDTVFLQNSQRVSRQLDTPIRVIIGNPPYRAGDSSNSGVKNTKYKTLDQRVQDTYVKRSEATNKNSLYDHYIRAFRWASDRIGGSGIVCFVSNGGWLTGASGAGVRRSFMKEFNSIYVYNLRGNARCSGEERRKEKDNVFGQGSRTTIAITMLVKNPASNEHGAIHYHDIGDYLTREDKLNILKDCVQSDPNWETLTMDRHGDWLDKRDDSYYQFIPMGIQDGAKKLSTGMFTGWSSGVKTQRDAWAWNFSAEAVTKSMSESIGFFNQCVTDFENGGISARSEDYETDSPKINWTSALRQDLAKKKQIEIDEHQLMRGIYRPFCRQVLWFDRRMNERVYRQPSMFPYRNAKNVEICLSGDSALITDAIPDLHFVGDSQCFPLYWYEKPDKKTPTFDLDPVDEHGYVRHDVITDTALRVFHAVYPQMTIPRSGGSQSGITKEDIFYYVYGILHSPEYRKRFASNLGKELPRIPLAKDFLAFMQAGRELADIHLHYETADRYPVREAWTGEPGQAQFEEVSAADGSPLTPRILNPGRTEKMTYPNKVKDPDTGKKTNNLSTLQVSENVQLQNIPTRAYDYMVNGKSAIAWLIDRYRVTTDPKSGIVNDPNDYSPDPRYIVDLVERVITVSMRTLDIMDALPPIEELPQTTNWPKEWNVMQQD
ncbi:DNA helicase restriction enzyme type III Res subunit [Bifidobacterium porcinum]|nr:DNA helicase restriction enzyme type III Res subunit [Bifidobacterium porcinum]